jgi:hypothetical protein
MLVATASAAPAARANVRRRDLIELLTINGSMVRKVIS